MARVFLDTNIYIDVIKRAKEKWEHLRANLIFISPLSTHILFYSYKLKVPDQEINELQDQFRTTPLTETLVTKALKGPTRDFEDNVQLHSANEARADYFLTSDKKLLKMKFFGDVEIVTSL